MNAIEIIKQAQKTGFVDKKGKRTALKLDPPLSPAEVVSFENSLPCKLPLEERELLQYCRGISVDFDKPFIEASVCFSGSPGDCDLNWLSPHSFPIVADGDGNDWVVDLTPESTGIGPIFYNCHDPPVMIFQSESLTHFIQEILKLGNAPWKSEITDVQEDYAFEVYANDPGVSTYEQCLASEDADLKTFASSLDASYLITDLRQPTLGAGFSWGTYGADTVCKRFGAKRIVAVQQRKRTWMQKFFGV
jgi:hypothetical protein